MARTTAPPPAPPAGALEIIPVAKIKAANNVRGELGDLSELQASVAQVGVLAPILVTRNGDGYTLVAGFRRFTAAKRAGLTEIPAVVRDVDEGGQVELQLVENLQRLDLTPVDEARGFRRLIDEFGYSQRDVARTVGRAQSHVNKRLALLELPEDVQAKVGTEIPVKSALELTKLAGDPDRLAGVVKEAARYRDGLADPDVVEQVVDEAVRDRDRASKLAEVQQQAEADPAPFVAMKPDRYGRTALEPPAVLLGAKYGHLNLSPAKHRKAECHAITVVDPGAWGGDPHVAYVCLKPKNHPEQLKLSEGLGRSPGPMSAKEKAAKAKHREHAAALAEDLERRRTFLRERLAKRVVEGEALAMLVATFLGLRPYASFGKGGILAADLLGVKIAGNARDATPKALLAFGRQSKTNTARLALALAIETPEATVEREYWSDSVVAPYYTWLRKQGYRPSAAERLGLAGKAPR